MKPDPPDWKLLSALALVALVLELIPNLLGGYGYFIDELYYIACANRLALGYVDHPPLAPLLLRGSLALFGDSVAAIRTLPALAGAATVLLTGWLAARLGGGRFAQGLAAITVLAVPVFLIFFDIYSMNAYEILLWTALLATAVVMVERQEPRLWLLFGVLAGVALENKHTVVVLAFGILCGLFLTRQRGLLASRFLWLGGLVAALLFLPNLWWQLQNDFPSLEFYRQATLLKNRPTGALTVVWNQILFMNPSTFLLWGPGILFLFLSRVRLRFVSWAYSLLLAMLVLSQSSRPDRIAGLYPTLFAAGAVFWEARLRHPWTRFGLLGLVLAGILLLAPLSLPILPPDTVARYAAFVGIDTQIERGAGKQAALPQWLADRFGWKEFAADVREVVEKLSPDERARATILVPSYGHAGALELLEPELPPVISPHNTYHLWSEDVVTRLADGVLVSVDIGPNALGSLFHEVEEVKRHRCDYCMTWRSDMPIYVARGPKMTAKELEAAWRDARHFE